MDNSTGDSKLNQEGATSTESNVNEAPPQLSIEKQLEQANAKAAEYLDGWQRARADFANYRKRADKEREELYQVAAVEALVKFLPILDDFDVSVNSIPKDRTEDEVIKGFQMIHRKLLQLLEGAGIKTLDPLGKLFDPQFHEALGQDTSSNLDSGHVTAVLRKGYIYGDRVLRPALVRVSA